MAEFRRSTFVVGAGASAEFGFPVGNQLVKSIADLCRFDADQFGRISQGDRILRRAFSSVSLPDGRSVNPAYLAEQAEEIRRNMGLAPSIDNYLDAHKDIEHRVLVGKLAITLAIRRAERASNLWRDPRNVHNRINFATQPDNWMTELFRVLVAEQSKASFINRLQKCSFICFNYDRVIEQFFFFAIMSYFGLDSQETAKICSENLHVVHPYGTAGSYRYGDQFNDFGSDESDNEIIKAAESVRTFTEGVGDEHLVEAVHQSINSCEVLVFLGFAFHPLNIKSMRPKCLYNYSRVIGTCYGITEENLRILKSELSKDFFGAQEKIELQSMICADLIRFHAAYLSGRG